MAENLVLSPFCTLCCEPLAESYLRDLRTGHCYCDHRCYLGYRRMAASALERCARTYSEDRDRTCLAWNQFYEGVEAPQTVSQCQAGGERQRDVEILDAEIQAFNHLIATHCGT